MRTAGVELERLTRRRRQTLLLAAGAITALAWTVLAMAGGHAGGGHAAGGGVLAPAQGPASAFVFGTVGAVPSVPAFLVVAGMWMVMTVAMMLPAVLPWLLLFGSLGGAMGSTAGFAAGYFSVWAVYSLVAAALQLTLQGGMLLVAPAGPGGAATQADLRLVVPAAGLLLLVAGLFQFSSLKAACLRHCRNPFGFLLRRWRDGPAGAFRLGAEHGVWCLGCCWALMALGLALGVMNLLWMAVLTLVVCGEQIAPGGRHLGRVAGVASMAGGLWLIVAGA